MTREEFRQKWEDNTPFTVDEIGDLAVEWGLYSRPRIRPIAEVIYAVLVEAAVEDAEEYKPEEMDYEDE